MRAFVPTGLVFLRSTPLVSVIPLLVVASGLDCWVLGGVIVGYLGTSSITAALRKLASYLWYATSSPCPMQYLCMQFR